MARREYSEEFRRDAVKQVNVSNRNVLYHKNTYRLFNLNINIQKDKYVKKQKILLA